VTLLLDNLYFVLIDFKVDLIVGVIEDMFNDVEKIRVIFESYYARILLSAQHILMIGYKMFLFFIHNFNFIIDFILKILIQIDRQMLMLLIDEDLCDVEVDLKIYFDMIMIICCRVQNKIMVVRSQFKMG
jgi:hypothetical protein